MRMVKLGKTDISSPKNGFGALPIQRISQAEAGRLLRKAYDGGIRFFDTARFYTDSEEKIGLALADKRQSFCLASKTMATEPRELRKQLEASLKALKTDYLDLYQFHNPAFCPKPGDGSGLYEEMLRAKEEGLVRHIGITNHRLAVASEALESGLYETLQFPFSYLADPREIALAERAEKLEVGFIAMKALSGGLIGSAEAAYAWLAQYQGVLPIWGIQREAELDQFLSFAESEPVLDDRLREIIDKDQKELMGEFCRGCGYCMPCPVGIEISTCARMSLMIRRAPTSVYLGPQWQEKMKLVADCLHCGQCKSRCPYGLDTPSLLERNWADYQSFAPPL